MPVDSLAVSYLQPAELATANKEFAAVLHKAPPQARALHEQKEEMLRVVTSVEQRMGQSVLATPLYQADGVRDRCFVNTRQLLHGLQYHFEEQRAAAAGRLYRLIASFGARIYEESYAVESHKLNALLAALKTPENLQDVRLLELEPAITRLEGSQQEFERLRQSAVESEARFDLPQLAEFIGPMRRLLDEAITYLRSFARREPETYRPLVAEMNELIEDYAAKIQARRTRKENAEKEAASASANPQN